jgi:ankyrin repeat protein
LKLDVTDVNEKDWGGRTCIYAASYYGLDEVVKRLLELGADFRLNNNYGDSPIKEAVWHGHLKCVELLLNAPG